MINIHKLLNYIYIFNMTYFYIVRNNCAIDARHYAENLQQLVDRMSACIRPSYVTSTSSRSPTRS